MSDFLNLSDVMYEGVGEYNIPVIYPNDNVNVSDWIGFNYTQTTKKDREKTGVHFFIWDQQFERVWNYPNRYTQLLKEFGAVLTPDFSTYLDFPKAIQIYNHYRRHWLGAYWQDHGVNVIPTIRWGTKDSFDWCFDGEPEGSIIAVSNIGVMDNAEERKLFREGYNEMLIRLQPKKVLFYAHIFDDYPGPVHFIKYSLGKADQKGE